MDNVTHTLIGVMVGETAHRFSPGVAGRLSSQSRRTAGITLMVLGNNLPDADFLYPALTGSKLDYLLQHRGHTHTVLGALLIALLMLAALRLWFQWRGSAWSRSDALYLGAMALLAPMLHLGLDFTNSYGVHPFWPFDNRWFYGDAVFIIEPLLWICATPLLFTLRSMFARVLVGLALITGIGLCIGSGMVPMPLVAALVLLLLTLAAVGRAATARNALVAGLVTWLAITAVFFTTGSVANARISALLARDFSDARTLDLVLTPLPVNPFCREVFVVQTNSDYYVVRKAAHSLAPAWFPAAGCSVRAAGSTVTAPFQPVTVPSTAEMNWIGEITLPRPLFGELSQRYCAVHALLHFARVPWAHRSNGGWVVGDLRYDREPELAFAEVAVSPGHDDCPGIIPDWVPPRDDLLSNPHSAPP
jgi:inner membrane protein